MEEERPTLYLETSVPSYLTARLSSHLVVLTHQQLTREWWAARRDAFTIYVSPIVLEEVGRGDPERARERLELLAPYHSLAPLPEVAELTAIYLERLRFPKRAALDAAHLAFASSYAIDYLLTWNCKHIANAEVRRRLRRLNDKLGRATPTICTPEELMRFEEDD